MTPRTWARFLVFVVAALVVQVAVLDQIVILQAHPDVMVLIPVAAGLGAGAERGALFGFVAGLAADLVVSLPFGMSALVFVLVGFVSGLARALPGWSELRSGLVLVCALGAGIATIAYGVLGAVLGQPGMLGSVLFHALVVVIVSAVVLSPFVIVGLRWVLSGSSQSTSRISVPSGGSASA